MLFIGPFGYLALNLSVNLLRILDQQIKFLIG